MDEYRENAERIAQGLPPPARARVVYAVSLAALCVFVSMLLATLHAR